VVENESDGLNLYQQPMINEYKLTSKVVCVFFKTETKNFIDIKFRYLRD